MNILNRIDENGWMHIVQFEVMLLDLLYVDFCQALMI